MAKTLHYNFLTNPTLTGSEHPITTSPDLSFIRATKATMVDADGYIREVQAGEARFTGATFNQNLEKHSNTFSDANWAKFNSSVAQDATDYLGNTNTAWTITSDGLGPGTPEAVGLRGDGLATAAKIGHKYLLAWDIKAGTATWAYIYTGVDKTWFNLSTGAVGTTTGTTETGIVDLGGGWYRCWVTRIVTVADVRSYIIAADDDNTLGYTNTSADAVLTISRAHLSDVSGRTITAPDTYIATTTVAKTSLTGTSTKGLLVEEARTNICLQSEDILTTWVPGDTNTTAGTVSNQTTAPDGSTTADKILDNNAGGTSPNVYFAQSVTVANSTTYTFSVFAKQDQLSWLGIGTLLFTTPGNVISYFDLANGVVGTAAAGHTSGIEGYGNGWYRCWITFTTDATDTSGQMRVYAANADTSTTVDLDGTSSIFAWGAQLEAGSFPTSYIPTTTASVTRNADDFSNQADISWHSAAAPSSWYFKATPGKGTPERILFDVRDADNSETRLGRLNNSSQGLIWIGVSTEGGSQGIVLSGAAPTAETEFQWAIRDATDDSIQYLNGSAAGTDTACDVPGAITEFNLGRSVAASGFWNGHIAEIAYFNERLADATLEDYSLNGLPTAFPGTVAGDGGHIWPARSNDPRWAQIITDSGITPSGNFIDDVHAALEAMASDTGAMDDLWKKVKAVYSITDTSEPFSY